MKVDCIPETSYFASPDFLATVLHILGTIELPIHAFGAYVILCKTPKNMKSVKWPLMNLHFWSLLLDLSVSLLTIPFILAPEFCGYPLGILRLFGVPTFLQAHVVITEICVLLVSFPAVYANRYMAVSMSITRPQKNIVKSYVIAIYTAAFTYLIPFTMMMPEQTAAVAEVFRRLPCLPLYIYEGPVFVLTMNIRPLFIAYTSMFGISVTGILFFSHFTVKNLLEQTRNRTMSQKTAQLQKRFLECLMVQTMVPLLVLCPLVYLGYSVLKKYYNQALTNFTFIFVGCHGLLSTVVMLWIHQPYKTATIDTLKSLKILKKTSVQITHQRNSNILVFSNNDA